MHKNISRKYPRASHVQAIEATHMMSIVNLFMRPNERACKPIAANRWSTITYLRKWNTSNHERTSNTEQSRKHERVICDDMQPNNVELQRTRMSTWKGNENSVNMKTQREKTWRSNMFEQGTRAQHTTYEHPTIVPRAQVSMHPSRTQYKAWRSGNRLCNHFLSLDLAT